MDENELKIISEISKNSQSSQRHLSKASNLSLGMVNLILHRLVEKGYMKVKQLDGRRVQYILTPKGFSEKLRRSASYVRTTVMKLTLIKDAIKTIINRYSDSGTDEIVVVGGGELAVLVDLAHKELGKHGVTLVHEAGVGNPVREKTLYLFSDEGKYGAYSLRKNFVDLHRELAGLLI